MSELQFDDMKSIVGFMAKDITKLMKAHRIFLAGGYIRARIAREEVNDVDLFSTSKEACESFATALAAQRSTKVHRTRNAFTVIAQNYHPVQFIHRWTFDDPEKLVNSFDFSVARAAIWFENGQWKSFADPSFYPDVAAKRLNYCAPIRAEDSAGSILRVLKFAHRGYHISPEMFSATIVRMLSGVNPETNFWNQGEDAQARIITGLMRHVDPLTVVEGLMPSDDSLEDGAEGERE